MHWVLHEQRKASGVACFFRGVRKKDQFKRAPKARASREILREFLILGARKYYFPRFPVLRLVDFDLICFCLIHFVICIVMTGI